MPYNKTKLLIRKVSNIPVGGDEEVSAIVHVANDDIEAEKKNHNHSNSFCFFPEKE